MESPKNSKNVINYYKQVSVVLVAITFFMAVFILANEGIMAPHTNTILKDKPICISQDEYKIIEGKKKIVNFYSNYPREDCAPIEIYYALPKEYQEDVSHIMFSHSKSWARVWVEDKLIYSFYPEKNSDKYDYPASIFHIAKLPSDWEGKELHIEIIPAVKKTAKLHPNIFLGSHGSLILHALFYALPKALLCILLGLIAILIFSLSFIRGVKENVHISKQARSFSYFLLDIAVWALLETRIRQFIVHNNRLSQSMVTVAYFLIPIFFAIFLNSFNFFAQKRSFRCLYDWSYIQFFIFVIGYYYGIPSDNLQFLMQITSGLLIAYMIISISTATMADSFPKELKSLYKSSIWLAIGFVAEIIHFYFFSFMQSGIYLIVSLMFFSVQNVYYTLREIIDDSIEAITEQEKLIVNLEEERVRSMMTQMNPHFLYNALTSIQAIVKTDPDYAFDMIKDFSTHLRSTVKELTVEKISFSEEMENVKAFMNLEKMRFGDHLNIEYSLRCTDFDVIPLCVQPLVENSCRHGLFPKGKKGGNILVKSYEEYDNYVIQVIDDGVGFDIEKYLEESTKGIHIGIYNIKYRLKKVLNADIDFVSSPEMGTIVTIEIPKQGMK